MSVPWDGDRTGWPIACLMLASDGDKWSLSWVGVRTGSGGLESDG